MAICTNVNMYHEDMAVFQSIDCVQPGSLWRHDSGNRLRGLVLRGVPERPYLGQGGVYISYG